MNRLVLLLSVCSIFVLTAGPLQADPYRVGTWKTAQTIQPKTIKYVCFVLKTHSFVPSSLPDCGANDITP